MCSSDLFPSHDKDGSVSVLPSVYSSSYPPNSVLVVSDDRSSVSGVENAANSSAVTVSGQYKALRPSFINSDLSALSIRATEYLQRWKK